MVLCTDFVAGVPMKNKVIGTDDMTAGKLFSFSFGLMFSFGLCNRPY